MSSFKPELRRIDIAKRSKKRKLGKAELFAAGIPFESKNGGAHLIVKPGTPERVDFWPGNGLWKETSGDATGRGLESLFSHLRVCPSTQDASIGR